MVFDKRGCTVLVVILAIVIGYIVNTVLKAGLFKTIGPEQEHGNKNCEILTKKNNHLIGCEDAAQFDDGTIILSCSDKSIMSKEILSSKPMTQVIQEYSYDNPGYLFSMKHINSAIDSDEFAEIKLLNRVSPDFSPHGVSVITDKKGIKWIYLINHRRDGDVVEIYQLNKDNKVAIFKDEVLSPLFVFINDLKPILLDTKSNKIGFYVSNSYGFRLKTKLNVMENILGLQQSDFIFCEPDMFNYKDRYSDNDKNSFKSQWKCYIVDTNTGFGNGVDISIDGNTVYLVEMIPMRISVYDRNKKNGTLTKIDTIYIGSNGDNLYLDEGSGDLYIGCHPNMIQVMQHTMDHTVIAPSQILHWNKKTGDVEEIYLSNGHTKNHVSASSVGIYDTKTKTLLIGTVATGTMRCKL